MSKKVEVVGPWTRPKTTVVERYIFILLVVAPAFGFLGWLAWATTQNWLLIILFDILAWVSGRKLGRWAVKGRNGPSEECMVCHHHILYCECLPKEDDAPSA